MAVHGVPEELASSEPAVRAFLANRLHGSELEDATQTVMERALERLEVFASAERPRAWLMGVARNVAFEVLRARARAPVPTEELDLDSTREPPPNAEQLLDHLQQSNLLYRALDGLRLDDRLVLLMTYVDGVPGPEAAELLGISFPAFRQRLSRARRHAERRIRDLSQSRAPVDPSSVRAWQALLALGSDSAASQARMAATAEREDMSEDAQDPPEKSVT